MNFSADGSHILSKKYWVHSHGTVCCQYATRVSEVYLFILLSSNMVLRYSDHDGRVKNVDSEVILGEEPAHRALGVILFPVDH